MGAVPADPLRSPDRFQSVLETRWENVRCIPLYKLLSRLYCSTFLCFHFCELFCIRATTTVAVNNPGASVPLHNDESKNVPITTSATYGFIPTTLNCNHLLIH